MYCTNCGNKVNDSDKFCTSCGNKLDNNLQSSIDNSNVENKKYSGNKIASIVLGVISILGTLMIIFAPVALIISIIGLVLAFCTLKKESNLPGILLNSIGLVISLGICIVLMFIFGYVIDDINNAIENERIYDENYNDYNDNWGFGDYSERF